MISKKTPKERRIILKNADLPDYSNKISCYLKSGGYEMLKKSLTKKPEEIGEEVLKSGVRGRGGSWISHRNEMEVSRPKVRKTDLFNLQR
ncbi:hypothetical protein N8920_00770 [Opitutales bacterium]|nr:hypothetical protein [Opitutales bacterium]